MSEHTEQTVAPADAVPARIQLDDFVEAVTRGVARALAAQDDVSGYAALPGGDTRSVSGSPIMVGIFVPRPIPFPGLPDLTSGQAATFEKR